MGPDDAKGGNDRKKPNLEKMEEEEKGQGRLVTMGMEICED